jgi:Tol biopolymer transport system component
MGEVYRARDTALGRDVAIKMLPERTTHDPAALARFQREAQTLAALNHPNIGAIYGLVETGQGRGLVLEFVDGPTLADVISRSPGGVPLSESLAMARQIVDALDAAHERGIVHRDLKPANIKVRPDGALKVLDFGLAKALGGDAEDRDSATSHSPTITSPAALTRDGIILGTVAYMSPEQARGRIVDKRTDIWAFGCVLFETLTGRRLFAGETVADTISAILSQQPDWTLVQTTPTVVQGLLRRCLEKDPRRRLRDIGDARLELEDRSGIDVAGAAVTSGSQSFWNASRIAVVSGALVAVALAAFAAGVWLPSREAPESVTQPAARFSVPPPPNSTFFVSTVEAVTIALSPDGSQLGFVAESAGVRRVWIRALGSLEAKPVEGTEDAGAFFFSPDGRSIGFFAGNRLKKTDLSGGIAASVCEVPSGVGFFGSWSPKGHAIFASIEGNAIFQVPMAGGEPVAILKPDDSKGEVRILFPSLLPDGERFIYTATDRNQVGRVMVAGPGQTPSLILEAPSNAAYTSPGFLLFAREGALFALPFHATSGRATGEPIALGDPVSYMFGPNRGVFSSSGNGVLAFHSFRDELSLNWVDRSGRTTMVADTGEYLNVRISRDGTQALFDRVQPGPGAGDLWSVDLVRGIERRLTTAPVPDTFGMWAPDGRVAFFAKASGGPPRIHRKDLSTLAETAVLPQRGLQMPVDVSPNGEHLLFVERTGGESDLWALPLAGNQTPVLVVGGPFDQTDGRISPDGNLVAFVSNESGRPEVYVAPFPKAEGPLRVSVAGGRSPRWSGDGKQLFYISGAQELLSLGISRTSSIHVGTAERVFPASPVVRWRTFDVASDGRFLALIVKSLAGERPITVRTNWISAIAR